MLLDINKHTTEGPKNPADIFNIITVLLWRVCSILSEVGLWPPAGKVFGRAGASVLSDHDYF